MSKSCSSVYCFKPVKRRLRDIGRWRERCDFLHESIAPAGSPRDQPHNNRARWTKTDSLSQCYGQQLTNGTGSRVAVSWSTWGLGEGREVTRA